jgi:asparagine N-glycosylation enzyme membrane subunit Stt3
MVALVVSTIASSLFVLTVKYAERRSCHQVGLEKEQRVFFSVLFGTAALVSVIAWGMDLVGSCIGAFITSALLIPILGIAETCIALAMLNLTALWGLLLAYGRRGF